MSWSKHAKGPCEQSIPNTLHSDSWCPYASNPHTWGKLTICQRNYTPVDPKQFFPKKRWCGTSQKPGVNLIQPQICGVSPGSAGSAGSPSAPGPPANDLTVRQSFWWFWEPKNIDGPGVEVVWAQEWPSLSKLLTWQLDTCGSRMT